ncbi:AMP-binding protein, partial [Myxococcota bacterium]|nr:AMP-binding protein [Myxococcota bacterium]
DAAGDRRTAAQVGMLAGHAAAAVVGMLGVVESGPCLVPLSGHESDELLGALARDAEIAFLLTDRVHAARARGIAGSGVRVVEIEALIEGGGLDARDAATESGPEDLLAILYTSGTTASPKGVMTRAASVLARTHEYLEASGLEAGERQAAITAWHFAASIPEIYGALAAGAELCLFDVQGRGIEALPEWLRRERIDCLQLPVAIARRLLGLPLAGALAGVRFASIGGDRLLRSEAEALLGELARDAVLLHTFGSTETNLIAQLALKLPSQTWPAASEAGYLPVGRPVAGKRVVAIDEAEAPVAPGEIGRITVASPLVSPGYWKQPARTAEVFRTDADGARIFVSGDFGRLRADGQLELVGRDAARVKVRGVRVDLVAVEAALLAVEGVANAAVLARSTGEGDTRLVAYVEAERDIELETTRLRRALGGRLPAHAIPARFVFLEAMPWTPSGKIDRRALPDPGRSRPKQAVAYVAPRDPEEELVCARWAATFELDVVGVDDGFFDLGGDSLKLVELLFALEQESGRKLSLAAMDGLPTPARMAALLRRGREGSEGADAEAASTEERASAGATAEVGAKAGVRAGRVRRMRRALKLGMRNPLRAGGPILLGRPLAYDRGARLHESLARFVVRARLFRAALRPVATWHARLAPIEPASDFNAHCDPRSGTSLERALVRSVMANTWVDWRLRALERASDFERAVVVEGADHLDAIVDHGRGIVVVVTHVHWNALLGRLPGLAKRESLFVRQPKGRPFGTGPDAIVTERAEKLQAAVECLRRGGIVLIAGDEGHGRAAVEAVFHGIPRRFRPGAATLAEATGAALVPVFSRLGEAGRIVFRFEAPLVSTAETSELRILDCTARYAALYAAAWPTIYDSLTWKSARRALEPPDHW